MSCGGGSTGARRGTKQEVTVLDMAGDPVQHEIVLALTNDGRTGTADEENLPRSPPALRVVRPHNVKRKTDVGLQTKHDFPDKDD